MTATTIMLTLGGLGLFLLGMAIMSDSLRSLAGGTLRRALMRFTRSPLSGATTGAATTAVLQSSSATTVAAVGFVGAGLLTFPEALGIVFGANIGTTFKGWLVALLGFKYKIGHLAMILVFVGAAMRLFGRGRLGTIGMAVAGFGLIFVGIGVLQDGMAGLQHVIRPESLPPDTFAGRLKLVGFGVLFTLITQSSSAGVATALVALNVGAVNFHQAAALVIGMDIGTTVTAAAAAIGGTVGSRRTGLSHVIYNCMTGVGALLLISPYVWMWDLIAPGKLGNNLEFALVGFHSGFNILGVIIVLPFTRQFAQLIIRIIPDRLAPYTASLNQALLSEPGVALTALYVSARNELIAMLIHVNAMLGNTSMGEKINLRELQSALDETHGFLDRIHLAAENGRDWPRLIALIHALDHMQRLEDRCEEEKRAETAHTFPLLGDYRKTLISAIGELVISVEAEDWTTARDRAAANSLVIHDQVEPLRSKVVTQVASGDLHVVEATEALRAMRWMQRVSGHIAKITNYLADAREPVKSPGES